MYPGVHPVDFLAGSVVGAVGHWPLWAQELSLEHLLEIARTHTDRQQEAFYPACL
jgi:hypothetical protein